MYHFTHCSTPVNVKYFQESFPLISNSRTFFFNPLQTTSTNMNLNPLSEFHMDSLIHSPTKANVKNFEAWHPSETHQDGLFSTKDACFRCPVCSKIFKISEIYSHLDEEVSEFCKAEKERQLSKIKEPEEEEQHQQQPQSAHTSSKTAECQEIFKRIQRNRFKRLGAKRRCSSSSRNSIQNESNGNSEPNQSASK